MQGRHLSSYPVRVPNRSKLRQLPEVKRLSGLDLWTALTCSLPHYVKTSWSWTIFLWAVLMTIFGAGLIFWFYAFITETPW